MGLGLGIGLGFGVRVWVWVGREVDTWSENGTSGSAMPARVSWTKVETALEASTVREPSSEAQLMGMSTCRSA